MKSILEIQSMLEEFLGNPNQVYYQAPSNTSMKYPSIVYKFEKFNISNADNMPYLVSGHWTIHHMYKNPKSDLKEKFLNVPFCKFDRRVVSDGIYNDYYTLNG